MLQFEGKFIKKVNNDLPPPHLYRKGIKSSLKLWKKNFQKNREKNQQKNHGKGEKIKIGYEYIPLKQTDGQIDKTEKQTRRKNK